MSRSRSRALLLALPLLAGCYIHGEGEDQTGDTAAACAPVTPARPGGTGGFGGQSSVPDAGVPNPNPARPTACPVGPVDRWKELLIVDPSVVSDIRASNGAEGVRLSFRTRMEQLAGAAAGDLTQRWLSHWRSATSVPVTPGAASAAQVGITPRPNVDQVLLCPWLQLDPANACNADCSSCTDRRLPMMQAPFRLIAVVNRLDLATGGACSLDGGELRFVYTAVDPRTSAPLPFTVSFEYRVGLVVSGDRQAWAAKWRALGRMPFGPNLTVALDNMLFEGVRFTLHRVQTNEQALGASRGLPWELREFVPVPGERGGLSLEPIAASHTPRLALDGSAELGRWLQQNAGAILAGDNLLPPDMLAGAAAVPRPDFLWQAPGADPAVLAAFNRNSCSGCHGGAPAGGLAFQHIGAPHGYYGGGPPSGPAQVSRFLHDPAGGPDELGRRARFLEAAACEPCAAYPR